MNIHRIETGKVRIKQNQLRRAGGIQPKMMKVLFGTEWSDWLPIYAWVIEHPEGTVVVDTGETCKTSQSDYFPKWHPYYQMAVDFDVAQGDEIGPQMKAMGIDPGKEVERVIMTHLHTDHAGGMHHFPNAEFLIDRNEYRAASGWSGLLAGYLPQRWPDELDPMLIDLPDNPFGPFDKSMALTADGRIRLVSTPGHVSNHLSVIVKQDDLFYFLAGDASYTQDHMLQIVPDGVGTKKSIQSLEQIKSFCTNHPTIYLPSHDPDSARRMDQQIVAPVYKSRVLI